MKREDEMFLRIIEIYEEALTKIAENAKGMLTGEGAAFIAEKALTKAKEG